MAHRSNMLIRSFTAYSAVLILHMSLSQGLNFNLAHPGPLGAEADYPLLDHHSI